MRRVLLFFCVWLGLAWTVIGSEPAGAPRAATGEEIATLEAVLRRTADDLRRWAYTEHRVFRDGKGRVKSDVLLRYDPSQPYARQWTPLKIDGKDPSERERAKYRRRGEKSAPHAGSLASGTPATAGDPRRVSLGEALDLPRASIAAESATHRVFEIPLRKAGNERFPPEKFQVQARVRKEGAVLETIEVRLRDSFRAKLVVKVKTGGATIDFAAVDARHPPTMVRVNGAAEASMLFVSVGGSLELQRTELRHVRPFDERFEVQIGSLKALDF